MTKIILSILFVGTLAQAKTAQSVNEIKTLANQFIESAGKGNVAQAFPKLREYFPVEQASFDKFSNEFKNELANYVTKYGAYDSYRIFSEKPLGTDLHRITYMMKYANHPVKFDFYLFKSKTGWIVDSVYWNSNTKEFFSN